MGLVNTGIKKYPMSTVKYTAGSLMLWAYISAGGPGHLVQMHDIMDSIKYQQIKNLKISLTWTLQKMSEVNWREEAPSWSCESEGSGRLWMKELSLISYQVFSKLFRHYRRKLRAVILGKGCCNNCVPTWNRESIYFTMRFSPHFPLFYFNDGLEFFEWKKKD